MSNKKIVAELISNGLTDRIINVLSAAQNVNNQKYFTASDVAFEMLKRAHPHTTLTDADFGALVNQVSARLNAILAGKNTRSVCRTDSRVTASEVVRTTYPGRLPGYGFRIGVPIVPVMNKDMHKENKVLARTAEEIQRDPLPTIKNLLDGLLTKHLSDVIAYAIERKDKLYFEKNSEVNQLTKKLSEVTEMPPIVVNDLGVRKLSKAELDLIAVQQAGVVGAIKEGDGVRDESVTRETLPGGWQVIWVHTDATGSGKLVLKSTNDRTGKLLQKGTLPIWVKDGLNEAQALALWNSHYPFKHVLAAYAGEVLSDPDLTELWLTHPREFGKGTRRAQWAAKHGDSLGLPLPAKMETTLAMIIYDLVDIVK